MVEGRLDGVRFFPVSVLRSSPRIARCRLAAPVELGLIGQQRPTGNCDAPPPMEAASGQKRQLECFGHLAICPHRLERAFMMDG